MKLSIKVGEFPVKEKTIRGYRFATVPDGFDTSGTRFTVRLERDNQERKLNHVLVLKVDGFDTRNARNRNEDVVFGDRLQGVSAIECQGWAINDGLVHFAFVAYDKGFAKECALNPPAGRDDFGLDSFKLVEATIFELTQEYGPTDVFAREHLQLVDTLSMRWISERQFKQLSAAANRKKANCTLEDGLL